MAEAPFTRGFGYILILLCKIYYSNYFVPVFWNRDFVCIHFYYEMYRITIFFKYLRLSTTNISATSRSYSIYFEVGHGFC